MSQQNDNTSAKVAILLCTYDGQQYLAEQLDSIEGQTYPQWDIWASDDGSVDNTRDLLEIYQNKWGGHLFIQTGPKKGFAANFLSLIINPTISADYYAYSDQDDIWEADKLSRALTWLETISPHIPAMYCSRTKYINQDGVELGLSTNFSGPLGFRNALAQSIAGGNTMVFNQAARDLVAKTPIHEDVVSHDWWTYLLVTGNGGHVYFDQYPTVRYRQHGNNIAGQNITFGARMARVKALFAGRYTAWNNTNIRALNQVRHVLTEENRNVLDMFAYARKRTLIPRLLGVCRSGVYRQPVLGNFSFFVAAILNKL